MKKIKVKLIQDVNVCDCCGKKNLKRALRIDHDRKIHLGVTCAGNRFNLNLSGNPYDAAKRLEYHINNTLDEEEFIEAMDEIEMDNLNI